MQNDLISRQAVIDIIHKEIERTLSFSEHETQINIEMAVEELPCAYDVEKVVAETNILFEDYLDEIIDGKVKAGTLDFLLKQNKEICELVRNGGKE